MDKNKKIIILIGIIITGFIGIYSIYLVNSGVTQDYREAKWNEYRQLFTEMCENDYVERGHNTIESCVNERIGLVDDPELGF